MLLKTKCRPYRLLRMKYTTLGLQRFQSEGERSVVLSRDIRDDLVRLLVSILGYEPFRSVLHFKHKQSQSCHNKDYASSREMQVPPPLKKHNCQQRSVSDRREWSQRGVSDRREWSQGSVSDRRRPVAPFDVLPYCSSCCIRQQLSRRDIESYSCTPTRAAQ